MTESEWNDARLNDFVRRINGVPERVVRLEEQHRGMDADMAEFRTTLNSAILRLEHREKAQEEKRQEERKEEQQKAEDARKERRREFWMIVGTVLTAAMLVVAALGLFIT